MIFSKLILDRNLKNELENSMYFRLEIFFLFYLFRVEMFL